MHIDVVRTRNVMLGHARRDAGGSAPPRRGWIAACAAVLLVTVLAASCGGARPAKKDPVSQAKWTVMVYMDGDQNLKPADLNLEPYVTRELDAQFAAVGSTAAVQVVALADRGRHPNKIDGSWTGVRLFHATKGQQATAANAVADWGQADMGSPETLLDFITWARAHYPAEHYALFLWDHGWGWWPGNTMEDDTSNDYLDMDELRHVLEAVHGVDMVGMDTCLGQTIEVQAELRGFADAVAGSEDATGYTGFHYDEILHKLQADPGMSASNLAVAAAQSMRTRHDQWTLAASAVSLGAQWDALTAAVSDLGWDLGDNLPAYRGAYALARRQAPMLPQTYPEVRDLYGAAYELWSHVKSPVIRGDCLRVVAALRKVVLFEWHTKAEGRLRGIAIYWPDAPAPPAKGSSFSQWVNFSYYCSQLTFTRLTYWGDFLSAWGG